MNKCIFILLCFILIDISFAQYVPHKYLKDDYLQRHISSKDGLSQVTIRAIVKDNDDYIWIGTADGLNRFDGKNIIQFFHNSQDKYSLCGNFINALFKDRKGRIWIGTTNQGFCYYDPVKAIFIRPELSKDLFEMSKTCIVTAIVEDHLGCIWINTKNHGILRIKEHGDNIFKAKLVSIDDSPIISTSIFISTDNTLWVGTENGHIYWSSINVFDETPKFFSVKNLKIKNRINCFIDDDNIIWAGTNEGLWYIDTENFKSIFFDLNTAENIKTRKYYVYSLGHSPFNGLWVGAGNGLYYLKNKSQFGWYKNTYLYDEKSTDFISHNTIYSLLVDNNLLWIGTAKNLDIVNFSSPKFTNLTKKLINPIVLSVYKDADRLWVGTAGGLNLFEKGNVYSFKENPSNPNSLSDNIIKSITPDNKGHLWFGTTKGISIINVNHFNPKKPLFTCIYSDKNNSNSLSGDNTTQIYRDNNNQIWVTTISEGLNRFIGNINNKDYRFQQFKHLPNNPKTISSNNVYCITHEKNGCYWIGTLNGLDKLQFTTKDYSKYKITPYIHNTKNPNSISSNAIKNIYFDKNGIMWIGTRNGFNEYHKSANTFQSYFTDNGLPNNVIYSMQEDNFNHIWLGTNKGLSCFDKTKKQFINFYTKDGLAGNEFNTLANFKDKDGLIYMGNIDGLSIFNAKTILQESKHYPVLISEILKSDNNLSQALSLRNIKRITPVIDRPVELDYNNFPLYVKFACPQAGPFQSPDYFYKLEPTDNDWNYLGNHKDIQLLNLSPGNYTLLLAGGQHGTVWKDQVSRLPLVINPPWWQSTWAYSFYTLLFLSIIFAFYRFSLKRKLEHQENLRLLELDELKTKLYSNITHELRTPLTVIMGMVATIKQKLSTEELRKIETKLKVLSNNSNKLLFLINQMLDLNKIESGKMKLEKVQANINPFVKVNIDSFHSLSQHKNIELIYYDENDEIVMDFDPDKMSIILSNLLSNAIKFTPEGGKIVLHIKKNKTPKQTFLQIKIRDNGIGISEENQKHIFDRFYQVDAFTPGGTGIGLSLVKELVKLMNGSITVKSKLHQGTEFIIEIPITNKAKTTDNITMDIPLIEVPEDQKIDNITTEQESAPLLLIIEDNRDVSLFIASCLFNQYQIIFAQDGQDGILKALKSIPDLIITDLMMPKIDGFEVCQKLKNNEKTSHIPIVMLTARTLEKDKIKGFAYGADAYVTKPFSQNELRIRIEQLILTRKRLQEKYQKNGFYISTNTSKETNFINKCIKNIHDHLDEEHFKSAQLAYEVNLSESQLYRKIKAITNLSTAIFIREVRLTAAKEMLLKTDLNISEIAYKTGFSNPEWFSKSFKEKFGYSPSHFRQNN